ncbi:MAG: hypothetical protein KDA80_22140 [Planctomycetaceae bacterium]|nr:hypothetical protein [Planctomycetaceae bacterium]
MPANDCDPQTLDTPALAKRLSCSVRHIATMDKEGGLPRPVRLGKLKRWVASEIDEWLKAGAPSRKEWEARKVANG